MERKMKDIDNVSIVKNGDGTYCVKYDCIYSDELLNRETPMQVTIDKCRIDTLCKSEITRGINNVTVIFNMDCLMNPVTGNLLEMKEVY